MESTCTKDLNCLTPRKYLEDSIPRHSLRVGKKYVCPIRPSSMAVNMDPLMGVLPLGYVSGSSRDEFEFLVFGGIEANSPYDVIDRTCTFKTRISDFKDSSYDLLCSTIECPSPSFSFPRHFSLDAGSHQTF